MGNKKSQNRVKNTASQIYLMWAGVTNQQVEMINLT